MNLFKPTTIGSLEVKNHFIRSATHESGATEEGYPTEKIYAIYEKLARGDVGTVITSYVRISKDDHSGVRQLSLYDDDFISYYKEMADRLHELDTKLIVQLAHGCSQNQVHPEKDRIFAPSAIEHPVSGLMPKAMTQEDLDMVREEFVQAARRAKEAGADGVQLHCAHGYLLSQFISPFYNRREDEYGGTAENRLRYVLEVYESVRKEVGDDYPIWIKLNCTDEPQDGLTTRDFLIMGKLLADAGIDAIEVSGGRWRFAKDEERNYYLGEASELAEEVDVPVILTGGIREWEDMNDIANETKVNLFGFSRPFLKNPNFLQTLK